MRRSLFLRPRQWLLLACLQFPVACFAADDISAAENALFMTDHLKSVAAPTVLHYNYGHAGTLEEGFSDAVDVRVDTLPGTQTRSLATQCMSGARAVELPPITEATGNPALLCFLERDIREMERLTGGKSNYFRKRIRQALADKAQVKPMTVSHGGRKVSGTEIRITPYVNDPLKERFARYAGKYYVFRLSEEIPGGIVDIVAVIPDSAAKAHLVEDTMSFSSADSGGKN